MGKAGALWSSMSEEDKKPYEDLSKEDKKR